MGSGLTEREVVDCLSENFRLAAQNAELLAKSPKRGQIYLKFRDQLRILETCSRQMGYMRGGDARWLQIGRMMAETHKRAGDWLRGVPQPGGGHRPLTEGQKHPLFMMLADKLRKGQRSAEDLRDKKTGRRGPILPIAGRPTEHRATSPVGWRSTASGLVIPAA